jgi:hypothetical protein
MTVRVQNQRLMRLRPCRLLCQISGFFISAGFIIIISIVIIIISRKPPNETIAGKRFKERPEQRVFRFSHSSVVSDTRFQAEKIGKMAGERSAGVPEI